MHGGPLGAGAGQVDADRLRSTLDSLRSALAKPSPVIGAEITAALGQDLKRIEASLTSILALLSGRDLAAQRALSGVVREFRSRADAERLQNFLSTLRDAVRRHVVEVLGPGKLEVLGRLLSNPAPDVLGLLGRAEDENSHSEVLRWLLDPREARTVGPAALRQLVAGLDDAPTWQHLIDNAIKHDSLSVRREYAFGREWDTDSLDRIDIVITGPGFVLAIENKVWAPEHDNQTDAYWEWLSSLQAKRAGIFLSPAGITARCPSFHAVSYLKLLAYLLEAPASGSIEADEESVLAGYCKSLARHVLRTELGAIREGGGAR